MDALHLLRRHHNLKRAKKEGREKRPSDHWLVR
jgi:hypothetical protein